MLAPDSESNEYISPEVLAEVLAGMDRPTPEEVEVATEGWEYKIVVAKMASSGMAEEQLNLLGQAGWDNYILREMSISEIWYYFKRARKVDDE